MILSKDDIFYASRVVVTLASELLFRPDVCLLGGVLRGEA